MEMSTTYRAFGVNKGEHVKVLELPVPAELQPGELLIQVKYAGINPMDGKLQQLNVFNLPEPMILGFEWSGTVAATGDNSNSKYQVGQAVFGFSTKGQCFAEYLVVPETWAWPMPDFIDPKLASIVGIAYVTAYESLVSTIKVNERKGQTIFIQGAGGAVGSVAAIIAKRHGLIVIGSSSKPQQREFLKNKLKVDHVVDYRDSNVHDEVMRITNGRGCDVVYDPTYLTAAMAQSATLVAKDGLWCRLGPWNHLGSDDTEARRIVNERGASENYGHWGRYWFEEEYQGKRSQVWGDACEDFISASNAGLVEIEIAEIPFDTKALDQAMVDVSNVRQCGRILLKISP